MKTKLLFVCIPIALALIIYSWIRKENPEKKIELAYCELNNKNFYKGRKYLDQIPSSYFYKACFAFVEGNRVQAKTYLQNVKQQDIHWNDHLCLKKLITYVESQGTPFPSPLFSDQEYFLAGLSSYFDKNYEKALSLWNAPSERNKWIVLCVNHCFSQAKQNAYIAHALIEEGRFQEAATHIEALPQNFYLLKGLLHLKESNYQSLEKKNISLQAAIENLKKEAPQKDTLLYASIIEELTRQTAIQLLMGNLSFEFLNLLAEWKEEGALKQLAILMASQLVIAKEKLIPLDNLKKTVFYDYIHEELQRHFQKQLSNLDLNELTALFSTSAKNILTSEFVDALIEKKLLKSIECDNEDLTQSIPLFKFWYSICDQETKPLETLFSYSKHFWALLGSEKKAFSLMNLSFELSKHDPHVLKKIEDLLIKLYVESEKCNLIDRLTFIYDALNFFQIPIPFVLSQSQVANYLEDGKYFFKSHHYRDAKNHAEWVLRFEPNNDSARRLLGLSCFHLGEYQCAYKTLAALSEPDDDIKTILIDIAKTK